MTLGQQLENVKKILAGGDCDIEILPPDPEKAAKLSNQREYTPMAAILAGTGGVNVNGIVRLCGSGIVDFFERNSRLAETELTVFAEDIFGGIFGLDKNGIVDYFAPDELAVEEFCENYNEFLEWLCCREDFDRFYSDYLHDCPDIIPKEIPIDKGVSVYPPLWGYTEEKRSAAAVPITQLQDLEIEMCKKLAEEENQ